MAAAARLTAMTAFRVLRWAAGLSLLVAATACGQGGAGVGGAGGRAFDPDELVLRVQYTGGFVEAASLLTRVPIVSVYGDGRVITDGPVPAIYPGPALPNLQVQKIATADVNRLVTRALTAGVGRSGDLGQPTIADAASTRFTVLTDGGPRVTEVYALVEAPDGQGGLTEAQRAARADLRTLFDSLTNLPATLGAGAVGPSQPYVATAVAAVATPWTDPGDAMIPTPPALAWPGPALPGQATGTALSCVAAGGDQAAQVLAAARGANTMTPWTSGGTRWTVRLRPLLPDETGCDSIAGR